MSAPIRTVISLCLLGGGVVASMIAGGRLMSDSKHRTPPNPLGIQGSPYGEVLAMAMQDSISTYFNEATISSTGKTSEHETNSNQKSRELPTRVADFLGSLEQARQARTNPKPASPAQRLYARRQVENKLRFAYKLDPANYANYNSLHFFLTQPQLGTRPELTQTAAKLAEETIHYCLKQKDDPRPLLTAAGACTNVLELMFDDQLNPKPRFKTDHMRQYLNLLDHCLARYVQAAQEWDRTHQWEFLSPARIAECDERFNFISTIRDTAEKTILRHEGKPVDSQASHNP